MRQPDTFIKRAYASAKHLEFTTKVVDKKVVEVSKFVPTAAAWMEWEHRSTVKVLDFAPGGDEFTKSGYNLWRGWPVEPKAGDVKPWTLLLNNLFQNVPPNEQRWFEQWCAFPIQNPWIGWGDRSVALARGS